MVSLLIGLIQLKNLLKKSCQKFVQNYPSFKLIYYIYAQVKVLYVNNLATKVSEEMIKEIFSKCGQVDRVKKIKDYAFVHFQERSEAMKV